MTLKGLRKQHCDLSQKQLASFLHVDRSVISKWESGKQAPNREMAMKIARFFDVPFVKIEEMFLNQKKQRTIQNNQINIDTLLASGGGVCQQ